MDPVYPIRVPWCDSHDAYHAALLNLKYGSSSLNTYRESIDSYQKSLEALQGSLVTLREIEAAIKRVQATEEQKAIRDLVDLRDRLAIPISSLM